MRRRVRQQGADGDAALPDVDPATRQSDVHAHRVDDSDRFVAVRDVAIVQKELPNASEEPGWMTGVAAKPDGPADRTPARIAPINETPRALIRRVMRSPPRGC